MPLYNIFTFKILTKLSWANVLNMNCTHLDADSCAHNYKFIGSVNMLHVHKKDVSERILRKLAINSNLILMKVKKLLFKLQIEKCTYRNKKKKKTN